MAATRHTREQLDGFLDREFRQVWALHRSTGERLFIELGTADALRPVAKEHWRCPAPECTDPISLRGKTRRDHLYHLNQRCTGGGPESLWHLQGKAMLAHWAESQPGSLDVTEEQTVKDAQGALHRRADVMVRWPAGNSVAFEVEYKKAPPENLLAKHDQYQTSGTQCTWLFGHTHVRLARRPPHLPPSADWNLIRWTPQLQALAQRGLPLLIINPVTRQIGTVVIEGHTDLVEALDSRYRWWEDLRAVGDRLPDADDTHASPRLVLDDLADCTLDPVNGLVTPAVQRIWAERAEIDAAAVTARRRWETEQAKRLAMQSATEQRRADQAKRDQERQARAGALSPEQRKAFARERADRDAAAWRTDPLRARTMTLFGGRLPRFVTDHGREDWGVHGHPEAWHCHLFEQLVLGGPDRHDRVGQVYTVGQAYAIVAERFALHHTPRYRSKAICSFLRTLDNLGYLRCEQRPDGSIDAVTVLSTRIDLPAAQFAPAAGSRALEAGLAVLAARMEARPTIAAAHLARPRWEAPAAAAPLGPNACRLCAADLSVEGHRNFCASPAAASDRARL